MKYLKLFEAKQTESMVAKICKRFGIQNWSINSEGLVDVDGDVDLSHKKLSRLPLKFGKVTGFFSCEKNQINTLDGSPKHVDGYFSCDMNILMSLGGSPTYVGGLFSCSDNYLKSLEGGPSYVGKHYYCLNNVLTNLKGAPNHIFKNFFCNSNNLTTLENCPREIEGDFHCFNNKLTTLRFGPDSVDGSVWAFGNKISDIPKKYLTDRYLQFIIKEQHDWRLYRKDGTLRLDRLEEMIEWGIETNKIRHV